MFGGGRNQQNGTECVDSWGGSSRQGGVVDGEMGEERRSRKESVMPLCATPMTCSFFGFFFGLDGRQR